eukprot:jgi/Bigna1/83188/fgenesh1_pg.103_\
MAKVKGQFLSAGLVLAFGCAITATWPGHLSSSIAQNPAFKTPSSSQPRQTLRSLGRNARTWTPYSRRNRHDLGQYRVFSSLFERNGFSKPEGSSLPSRSSFQDVNGKRRHELDHRSIVHAKEKQTYSDDNEEDPDEDADWHDRADERTDDTDYGHLPDDFWDMGKTYEENWWTESDLNDRIKNRLAKSNAYTEQLTKREKTTEPEQGEWEALKQRGGTDIFAQSLYMRPPLVPKDEDHGNYTVGQGVIALRSDGEWWPGTVQEIIEPGKEYAIVYYVLSFTEEEEKRIRFEIRNTSQLRAIADHSEAPGVAGPVEILEEIDEFSDINELMYKANDDRDYDWDRDNNVMAFRIEQNRPGEEHKLIPFTEEDALNELDQEDEWQEFDRNQPPSTLSNLSKIWENSYDSSSSSSAPMVTRDHDTLRFSNQTLTTIHLPMIRFSQDLAAQKALQVDIPRYIEMIIQEDEWDHHSGDSEEYPQLSDSQKKRLAHLRKELLQFGGVSENYTLDSQLGNPDADVYNKVLNDFASLKGNVRLYPPIRPFELRADAALLNKNWDEMFKLVDDYNQAIIEPDSTTPAIWPELPALFSEAYAYRRVTEIAGVPTTGRDYMLSEKYRIVRKSAQNIHKLIKMKSEKVGAWNLENFREFLHASTWASGADTIKYGPSIDTAFGVAAPGKEMIIDETKHVYEYMSAITQNASCPGRGKIAIVTGNSGFELLSDLVLATWLLDSFIVNNVVLVMRDRPVALQAWAGDLEILLDALVKYNEPHRERINDLYDFGINVDRLLNSKKLEVMESSFLSTPTPYFDYDLPQDLLETLQFSDLVIMKGDFQWRKVTGDREYPSSARFSEIAGYFPAPLVSLRVVETPSLFGMAASSPDGYGDDNNNDDDDDGSKEEEQQDLEILEKKRISALSQILGEATNQVEKHVEKAQVEGSSYRFEYSREHGAWSEMLMEGSIEERNARKPSNPGPDADDAAGAEARGTIQFYGSNTLWSEAVVANETHVQYLHRHTKEAPFYYSTDLPEELYSEADRLFNGDYTDSQLVGMLHRDNKLIWKDIVEERDIDNPNYVEDDPNDVERVTLKDDEFSLLETEDSVKHLIGERGRQPELAKIDAFEAMNDRVVEGDIETDIGPQPHPEKALMDEVEAVLPTWEMADDMFQQMQRKYRFERQKYRNTTFRPKRDIPRGIPGSTVSFKEIGKELREDDYELHDIREIPRLATDEETAWTFGPSNDEKWEKKWNKLVLPLFEERRQEIESSRVLDKWNERSERIKSFLKKLNDNPLETCNVFTWDEIREMGGPSGLERKLDEIHRKNEAYRAEVSAFAREDDEWILDRIEEDLLEKERKNPPGKLMYERKQDLERRKRVANAEEPHWTDDMDESDDDIDDADGDGVLYKHFPHYDKRNQREWINMDLRMGNYDEYDDPEWKKDLPR